MNDTGYTSISDLLFQGLQPEDATAIEAPGRTPLTYGQLREHVRHTVAAMNSLGYGRGDRIAVVLPHGPEMASAFLSIASGFACVPLNPQMTRPEFEQYLKDSGVRAMVVLPGRAQLAEDAGRALGIPVIGLHPSGKTAGLFTLTGKKANPASEGGFAVGDDIALVMHTSGTTSRPKRVLLTQGNVCYSAQWTKAALGLTRTDRCLNIMPLFYVHGLIGALLSSMAAGGSVVCTPGLIYDEFMGWLEDHRPTWYTATPAIHRKIVASIGNRPKPLATSLRLIRSAAAPLPEPDLADMESTFGALVLEGYGMTEAYQVSCNPLPPASRKGGSVGVSTGTEISTMDRSGNLLPAGTPGEVVVRGPNVMKGYDGDPEANANAFLGGWFRTGDLGYVDRDGYLFITGRIKEMINRGGEKVSPYEVETALLSHPLVLECAVFPIPDAVMGEEVGAAVVLKGGADVAVESLRHHVAERLSYFKVPSHVYVVSAIPKAHTGKVQRLGLAAALRVTIPKPGPACDRDYAAPSTRFEKSLAHIWSGILHARRIGAHENFFDLGGDSLRAAQAVILINQEFHVELPLGVFMEAHDLSVLAAAIENIARERDMPRRQCLVPLRSGGLRTPLFCAHTAYSNLWEYETLVKYLDAGRPIYGLQPVGIDGSDEPLENLGVMAARYVNEMRDLWPAGPYHLLGYSSGSIVAYEMARQLREQGCEVGFLGLIDALPPNRGVQSLKRTFSLQSFKTLAGGSITLLLSLMRIRTSRSLILPPMLDNVVTSLPYMFCKVLGIRSVRITYEGVAATLPEWQRRLLIKNLEAVRWYLPGNYPGRMALFVSQDSKEQYGEGALGWERTVKSRIDVVHVSGSHQSMIQAPNVEELAYGIDRCLAEYEHRTPGHRPGKEVCVDVMAPDKMS